MHTQAFNACIYMHKIVPIHADAIQAPHSKHAKSSMSNMREPMWMGTETAYMNETLFSSYAAHDHDPNCADIYADLQSMYLLCKSMYVAGLAQSTSTHSLTQARRYLCSSHEII